MYLLESERLILQPETRQAGCVVKTARERRHRQLTLQGSEDFKLSMFNWFIGYIAVGIIVIALHPELRLSFVSAITGQKMDLTGVVVAVFATLVTLLIWPVAIFFRTFVNSNRDRIWPQLKSQLAAEGVSFDQEDVLLTTLDSVICKKLREASKERGEKIPRAAADEIRLFYLLMCARQMNSGMGNSTPMAFAMGVNVFREAGLAAFLQHIRGSGE